MLVSSTVFSKQYNPQKSWKPSYLSNKKFSTSGSRKNILLLYDNPWWAYFIECKELEKYAPKDIFIFSNHRYNIIKTMKFDLIVQMCYGYIPRLLKYLKANNLNIPTIVTYTVGKGYDDKVLSNIYDNYCKHIIINNLGMYEEFGKKPKTIYIPNGVDNMLFHNKHSERKNKVLFIGSEYHRKVKSYDDILIPLKERLEKKNIECDFRLIDNTSPQNLMTRSELVDWYNGGKVYIVVSKSEGTPNPALEAAACGCTIVSTPVGNMPELIKDDVNGHLTTYDLDDIENKVEMAISNYDRLSRNMQKEIKRWDWSIISKQFYRYFLDVISRKI